jgi:hypothetical protein
LVEERISPRRAAMLLARLIDNIPAVEDLADSPTRSQTSEVGDQEPAEVAPTLLKGRAPQTLITALSASRGSGGCY